MTYMRTAMTNIEPQEVEIDIGHAMRYAKQLDASDYTSDQLELMVIVLAEVIGTKLDRPQALGDIVMDALVRGHNARGLSCALLSTKTELFRMLQKKKTDATKAASARWDSRADIELAKARYDEWMSGKLHYKSKADFAREIHNECSGIENPRTIESWVRRWEKALAKPK